MNADELANIGKTAFVAGCSLYLGFMLLGILVIALLAL